MRKLILVFSSLVLIAGPVLAATQAERGTPAQAKAMLDKAVAYYNSNGRKKALADFTAKKSPFSDRDLYVFCIGPDHKLIANGGFREFIGLSADSLKNSAGKSIGQAGWDIAMKKGQGDLHYQWLKSGHPLDRTQSVLFCPGGDRRLWRWRI